MIGNVKTDQPNTFSCLIKEILHYKTDTKPFKIILSQWYFHI